MAADKMAAAADGATQVSYSRPTREKRSSGGSGLKLERRIGSQSLCSSSSELPEDSSSSSSSSFSSELSTLSTALERHQAAPPASGGGGGKKKIDSSVSAAAQVVSRKPLTWRRATSNSLALTGRPTRAAISSSATTTSSSNKTQAPPISLVRSRVTRSGPTTANSSRQQLLHYGSLSSIPSPSSSQLRYQSAHYNGGGGGGTFDVRGRQQQVLSRISGKQASSSSTTTAATAAAATSSSLTTASSATTNSRLRQATLYARRHSHISPTQAAAPSKRPSSAAACPLITAASRQQASGRSLNQPRASSVVVSTAAPRISSLRISISIGSSSTRQQSKTSSYGGSLGQNQRKISSSAFSLTGSSSSLQQQPHYSSSRLSKRVKAAPDSPVARDPLQKSRRTTGSQPIGTKQPTCWRSNLPLDRRQQRIPLSKMTTAVQLQQQNVRFTSKQPASSVVLVAGCKKSPGDRSDGRSSSSGNSSAASENSYCGSDDAASECNENVPIVVTRARANDSSSSSSGCDENNDPNGHQQQQHKVIENFGVLLDQQQQQQQVKARASDNILAAVAAADDNNKIANSSTTTPKTSTLAVVEVAAPSPATDRRQSGTGADCCQLPLNASDGILIPSRDFSLNIVQNNNNNNNNNTITSHQLQQEENGIAKRPLSDTENNDDDDDLVEKKQDTSTKTKKGKDDPSTTTTMTNVKIKIQRKHSIAPDVPIKTEPICLYYDLEARPFARGKFAQVKRCINKTSRQCFAAKCIKKRRRLVDIRHEILLEIEALKLSYYTDHIVKLYEVYETPTEMILILEMANGGELQRVIDDEETIDEKLVKRMIRQILDGLVQLHNNDIAHLDIKPQNLLLTEPFPGGDVKLCDFGISRRITKDCEIREICGTPDYVAPEILRYDPISLATDMWSLGVLTYVLLTGYSPFGSENRQQTFCNITQATLDFPSEIFYKISEDAVDFMQKLIVREPSERLTSQQARNHPWLCSGQ